MNNHNESFDKQHKGICFPIFARQMQTTGFTSLIRIQYIEILYALADTHTLGVLHAI